MAGVVYAIVEFVASNSLAIVPVTWLNVEEDVCLWPPKGSKACASISSYVQKLKLPEQDWDKFDVRVLGKAGTYIYNTLNLQVFPI